MDSEKQDVWDKLKYGKLNKVSIHFMGDGVARKFNSGWISGAKYIRVTVDDVARSEHRDFDIHWNDIIFKTVPSTDSVILIEAYE